METSTPYLFEFMRAPIAEDTDRGLLFLTCWFFKIYIYICYRKMVIYIANYIHIYISIPSSTHLTPSGDLASRKLDRSLFDPSTSTRKYRAKDGSLKFQGNGKSLKETQVYPPAFGRKVTHLSLVLLVPCVNIDVTLEVNHN